MSSDTIKLVPDKVSDVTPAWFSKILGRTVRESTFVLIPNAHAGIGFLSSLVRVKFETKEDGKLYELIVKLLPDENDRVIGETRALVINDNYDRTEIMTYKILIPELIKQIPELGKYFCDVIFAEIRPANDAEGIPYSSVLVLQDLKPVGYVMVTCADSMTSEHFSQGLDFLSKLHAASLSVQKQNNESLLSLYSWFPKWYIPVGQGENRRDPTLLKFFHDGFAPLQELLVRLPSVSEKTQQSLSQIEKYSTTIYRKMLKAGQDYPCLVHADLWSHNIMVQEDTTIPVKVIDWQLIGYSDPSYDLAIFILLCLPLDEITVENVSLAATEYYQDQMRIFKRLGIQPRRSLEQFKAFFQTFGLAYGFIWIIITCSTFTSQPKYQPRFRKIFELLIEMGVIDFVESLV